MPGSPRRKWGLACRTQYHKGNSADKVGDPRQPLGYPAGPQRVDVKVGERWRQGFCLGQVFGNREPNIGEYGPKISRQTLCRNQ